jgi:metallo-beta-lactamase class B
MKIRKSLRMIVLASALGIPAQSGFGQSAAPELANIPQPHLAKARAEAFKENTWKFTDLITCYPSLDGLAAEHVIKDPGPGKAADNLYFLGNGIVAAWAVNTNDGIILIDTLNNQAEVDKFIIGGLHALGLDPARIKTIIVSHGHKDHYGGARYLQDKYHAKLYLTALDYDLAEKTAALPTAQTPAPRRDQVASDGDTVTLGDTSIKLFITPGHTPASLSMLIPVKDKGTARSLLFLGGITSLHLSPEMHAAYDRWTTRLLQVGATAKPEGIIGNHSSYDDAATKLDKLHAMPNKPNPFFVGAENTMRYVRVLKECNLNNRDIERTLGHPQW